MSLQPPAPGQFDDMHETRRPTAYPQAALAAGLEPLDICDCPIEHSPKCWRYTAVPLEALDAARQMASRLSDVEIGKRLFELVQDQFFAEAPEQRRCQLALLAVAAARLRHYAIDPGHSPEWEEGS